MATGAHPKGETCSEKLRLASEYGLYAAQYSRTVETLHQRMGVLSKVGYEELLRSTEQARQQAERSRLALNLDTKEHGC
jgi:hypothetical protein